MNSCKNNIVEPSLSQKKKKRRKGGEKKRKKKVYPVKGLIFFFISGLRFRFSFCSLLIFSRESRFISTHSSHFIIYIYFYITFRSNFSNRIVFDRKKKSLIDPLNDVNKKKKKKKINQRSRRIYFHVTFQSFRITLSLSLHRSYTPSAFARRIFTVRFRPFRGQQSPKYQTTLLTYRTFNNPSLGERNANNIEQIYRRLGPAGERTGE